tara:strand:+ start:5521 stop:5802 length:282 start_codon:yes stop_codon:yes gene_type:complete
MEIIMIMLNKDVYDYIKSADNETLNAIITQINRRRSALQEEAIDNFVVGQAVEFTRKDGDIVRGSIQKINRKTIHVKTDFVTWKVSPSLLRAA